MATLPPTPDWKALVGTAPIHALISPHTSPNGLRISGERGGEADERVRCMRVLGGLNICASSQFLQQSPTRLPEQYLTPVRQRL